MNAQMETDDPFRVPVPTSVAVPGDIFIANGPIPDEAALLDQVLAVEQEQTQAQAPVPILPSEEVVITMRDGKVFDRIINTIKSCEFENCNLMLDPIDGLSIVQMSVDQVYIVHLVLPKDYFVTYQVPSVTTIVITVPLLLKILNLCPPSHKLTIRHTIGTDELTCYFDPGDCETTYGRAGSFAMRLMTLFGDEDRMVPDVDYPVQVKMVGSDLSNICKRLATLGDTIKMGVSSEDIRFIIAGDMANGGISAFSVPSAMFHGVPQKQQEQQEEEEESETKGAKPKAKKKETKKKEAKVTKSSGYTCCIERGMGTGTGKRLSLAYAIKYLTMFCTATSISKYLTIKMHIKKPMCMEFLLGDQLTGAKLCFYLAPKVAEEEDANAPVISAGTSFSKKRKRDEE